MAVLLYVTKKYLIVYKNVFVLFLPGVQHNYGFLLDIRSSFFGLATNTVNVRNNIRFFFKQYR